MAHGQDEINIDGKLHFPGLNRVYIVVYVHKEITIYIYIYTHITYLFTHIYIYIYLYISIHMYIHTPYRIISYHIISYI